MNPNGAGAGDLLSSRCPKHPSQPPFTGFCSACLLERLSAARFPSPIAAEISVEIPQPRVRTTLLYLFQLDDMAPPVADQGQDGADQHDDQGQGGQLQRKRSLRQSCEWIVCCDTSADSRQSWDGSAGAPNAIASTSAKPIIRGFVTRSRPAQLLRRSLSESWRHARGEASRAGVPMNGAGSRSVSSAGMDSEISLGDSIHADAHNAAPRQSSLFKRLYRLGRSRSVHCSSPQVRSLDTGTLRFHLTPLRSSSRRSIANKIQGRRLNLFAGGSFFTNQRQQL
ncbi:hypothetical protein E2562_032447 [Oryza meyeriana var. granulata]|uniref:Uncharacterized protein n=1 Tax=Oryza meyeriana var. granulata TaxID=110450 RepID=A0A6G1E5Q5_9ORYZ|nr:hypothetical protein E2562_032447 [Oryza meyeriana var. granulata]